MSELPNPFKDISSAAIDADGPIAFMIDYGWQDEETTKRAPENEKQMLQEMWDVAQAQGRMLGQLEAGSAATERVEEKQARIEELETALARAEDDARTKAETFWEEKVRELEGELETARLRNDSALAALQRTKDRLDDLKAEVALERAERKIGFRFWWRLDRLAASAGRVTHSKLASYTGD